MRSRTQSGGPAVIQSPVMESSPPVKLAEETEPAKLPEELVEWLSLPEEEQVELLNGKLVYKAMSRPQHGAGMGAIFGQYLRFQGPPRGDGGGGWWLSQDTQMLLAGQGLRPDVVGWRVDRHPRPPRRVNVGKHLGVVVAPPDWVCEVLSRSTSHRDRGVKWTAYHQAGVEHYWLADLRGERITVYRRTVTGYEMVIEAGRTDVVALPPFESVDFVAELVFLMNDPEE